MTNKIAPYQVLLCTTLPRNPDSSCAYKLVPRKFNLDFYRERTDRNLGWITPYEQEILLHSVVGIAGTGGMGGLLASTLLRAGIGEIRISDCEVFDISNINRQFGATHRNVGRSKAFETARMLRAISDDSAIVVYPQGITEQTAHKFIDGCSVLCDEIEALAVDSRILFHQEARSCGVSVFNCNTIGFGTNLFLYTPTSLTMENALGLNYSTAQDLRTQAERGEIDAASIIVHAIIRAVAPKLPEYRPSATNTETDQQAFYRRLLQEGKVPIIGTNPPMATGFLANRILLYLLRNSGVTRDITDIPEMPGYLYLDVAQLQAISRTGAWF